ncbi:MAG: phenylalanine--tRNA ligase subunit alpha [Thermoflavifilum aggregans]|nr:phenylalanine--tRNA ligase subunit alpha [Thermoflavifilum aggregans]
MESLFAEIESLRTSIAGEHPDTAEALEAFRIKYLGSKGLLKTLFSKLGTIDASQRKEVGRQLNELKQFAEAQYAAHKQRIRQSSEAATREDIIAGTDITLPAEPVPLGSHHPLSIVRRQIVRIFESIGFAIAEGPEIEDDWHNFTSLNMPPDHPARDMQDTFYLSRDPVWLLRTHTSSVQARVLESQPLPVRVICPGRVYRNETVSARANCFFHQVEGLYVDKQVSFADLKQTLYYFVAEMFGRDTRVRFRPSYFPFTEPSAEMDISCTVCGGKGCGLCKYTGWVEILGCGMVHPDLLRNFQIDPEVYTGFAFGMGIERICQLKYRVNDLRLYAQNDIRFLRQFSQAQ